MYRNSSCLPVASDVMCMENAVESEQRCCQLSKGTSAAVSAPTTIGVVEKPGHREHRRDCSDSLVKGNKICYCAERQAVAGRPGQP